MKSFIKTIAFIILIQFVAIELFAQETTKDIEKMTREEILNIPYDDLIDMPLDQLLKLADIVGVSLEELYEMILNKDVVSASKKVESSFEAPLSTSVISREEIISSGASTIEEALRLAPGIIVREKTNGNFDVHLRGNDNLPPNHMFLYSENSITLVMIDGRPVYNYVHGGTFWETLPISLEDIDRIEIVRGPSSALYGPNAVSGVVNIITKRLEGEKLQTNLFVQGGTQTTLTSGLSVGKRFNDKFGIRVSGKFESFDRATEKLYVHKAEDKWIKADSLPKLPDYTQSAIDTSTYAGDISSLIKVGDQYFYGVYDPADGIDKMYPDPSLSRESNAANIFLFYDLNDDVSANLKLGMQNSEVISTSMGDNPMVQVGRESHTGYFDFQSKIHGLSFNVNGLAGWQDIIKQDTGFKVDMRSINSNLEYDFRFGNLSVRPGVAYQYIQYDDSKYLRDLSQGFLEGKKDLSSLAASLRTEYLMFEKLRLVGALRGEKYNINEDMYFSYQLAATYKLNDKHIFRFVNSKANRGPFLVDSYANYLWNREARPIPGYIYFQGNKDLDLLQMTMNEFGYRIKPRKNIQVDLEFFQTKTNNYSALYPDSVNLFFDMNPLTRPYVNMKYVNIDLEAEQIGSSVNISWVVNKNFLLKAFATIQKTTLTNTIATKQDDIIGLMLTGAFFNATNSGFTQPYFTDFYRDIEINKSQEYKGTPSYYGGFVAEYKFLEEKARININAYYYAKQEFESKYSTEKIPANFLLNAKIGYRILEKSEVFINLRNLALEKQQFAYMYGSNILLLGGISFNL